MDINTIVDAWERNQFPSDIVTLNAWKNTVDIAEHESFEAWRNSTCKNEGSQLVSDHLYYHEISMEIQHRIKELEFEAFKQGKFNTIRLRL